MKSTCKLTRKICHICTNDQCMELLLPKLNTTMKNSAGECVAEINSKCREKSSLCFMKESKIFEALPHRKCASIQMNTEIYPTVNCN